MKDLGIEEQDNFYAEDGEMSFLADRSDRSDRSLSHNKSTTNLAKLI